MKKLLSFILIAAFIPMLLTTGCKKESETTEFDTLKEYVTTNTLDLTDVLNGWVAAGSGFNVSTTDFSVPDYYVMDFRSATDFDNGHIKDAHNVTLGTMLAAAETAGGKPIMCVCYTGQTAARATGLLRMAGYNAKCLKWGMSSWHEDFAGKWNSNAADYASASWVTSGTPATAGDFTAPTFSTGKTEGADILKDRITAAIAMDWSIAKAAVLDNPDNYFINNYWTEASWNEFGHIKGAYRINEDLKAENLKYLNPSEDMVTYCYTGQTSSITTAWLQVMGYDKARSLLYGANGIVHTALVNGSAAKSSWKGAGSGSESNYGYYKTDGTYVAPK